jgi:hypothetical protein
MDDVGKTALIKQCLKVYTPQLVSISLAITRETRKYTELNQLKIENSTALPLHPDQPLPAQAVANIPASRIKYPQDILNKFKSTLPGINSTRFTPAAMTHYFTLCNAELQQRITDKETKISTLQQKLQQTRELLKDNMNKTYSTTLSISNPTHENADNDMEDFTTTNRNLVLSLTQAECASITAQYIARESAASTKKQIKTDQREAQRLEDNRPVVLTQGDLKKLTTTKKGPSKAKDKKQNKKGFRKGGKKSHGKSGNPELQRN